MEYCKNGVEPATDMVNLISSVYQKLCEDRQTLERNYRKLNVATATDTVQDIMDFPSHLYGKTIFSTIDHVRTYHHVPVVLEDIPKTVAITPFSLFGFSHMSFGLCNAAQPFQSLSFSPPWIEL
ncbi:hypothetical protein LAZ67_X004193 [Cordylochernes scorpioides]|uniref:Uncharacterized protein n=1 Tax=Cordylochernes scorpioides TaxID=51811 RepID=A0ABY6LXB9_9ARAC|nr:hypothetical protein LAZ67_X004193 [Cordylochernes scorpioides]